MYLTHEEYKEMGGTLECAAFVMLERRAEYAINAQAGGKTGERIQTLSETPQEVRDCVFELVTHMSANAFDGSAVKSESQSLGGQSESYTYSTLTKQESDAQAEEIIYNFLYPLKIGGVSVLYRGACV